MSVGCNMTPFQALKGTQSKSKICTIKHRPNLVIS